MASNLPQSFAKAANATQRVKALRDACKAQRTYLNSVKKAIRIVALCADTGSFEEGLALISSANLGDMGHLAQTEQERNGLRDIIEALDIGVIHYRTLRDAPEIYRKQLAAGFQKKDRLPPERTAPRDGMHKALESYGGFVDARHSPLLAPEERDFLRAFSGLAARMRVKYHAMQMEILND